MERRALFGNTALFDRRVGTESRLRSGSLMCFQERSYDARAEVRLWGTGDVRFILPAREEEERGGMGLPVVVEEVVASRLAAAVRSEEHTSELQSLMRISYAVFCLKKKK